ncbi:type II toxin-antitoxin system RelE/ParE family toxin [Paracoccus sp. S-4012]|uniref:type II toxin-antitoxin system RelE/ParE family toxin n=1 Tax=Paracoccus sp. S-4012 TaxID=2665648 RepID=UPI001322EEFF|nr:type II toxin-antitoxin system RelE/ParE family toxin [Paracoccus sp. S-4012]
MIEVRQTSEFSGWLTRLRDHRARARILVRIDRLADGHFGDAKYFEGIGELRVDYGPGYRVYFVRRGGTLVVLLCGGDKGSQKRDIQRASAMAQEV